MKKICHNVQKYPETTNNQASHKLEVVEIPLSQSARKKTLLQNSDPKAMVKFEADNHLNRFW